MVSCFCAVKNQQKTGALLQSKTTKRRHRPVAVPGTEMDGLGESLQRWGQLHRYQHHGARGGAGVGKAPGGSQKGPLGHTQVVFFFFFKCFFLFFLNVFLVNKAFWTFYLFLLNKGLLKWDRQSLGFACLTKSFE